MMKSIQQMAGAEHKRLRLMSQEARDKLNKYNEAQTDWKGTCRKCGKVVTGSLKDLREHVCEDGA